VPAVTFDAMARRFDDTMARARARAGELGNAADALAALRGRARSPGRDVEAVVDGRGALVSLWLAESAVRLSRAEVGARIVATAHAAALDASRRRNEVIADLVVDLGR
jgi:hypothetical protein